MWPWAAALLLAHWCCGSAQLLFHKIESIEYSICNETVIIPCLLMNLHPGSISELYVKWKFNGITIFVFDGAMSRITDNVFLSASIDLSELMQGNASLKMHHRDAQVGNYTCEVTELSREGEASVELKYRFASWFPKHEVALIIIFSVLAVLLFWSQFGFILFKYNFEVMNRKIIVLTIAGLLLSITVAEGATLFVTAGEYSKKKASGLHFLVTPLIVLVLLQFCRFTLGLGMATYVVVVLFIIQMLGYVLALSGLLLCISECQATHGPFLTSGVGIMAVAELLGLVYMKLMFPLI